MTVDIRTAAQRRKFASIEEMMNDPGQRGTEVKVAHRYGYWMIDSGDDIDADEIAEADAYLEAHIQHRISEARVTPTRDQIAAEMKRHHFNANRLDNQTWGMWMAECDCGWWSPEFHCPGESIDAYYAHAADAVLALMTELAEGEHDGSDI